MRAKLAVYIYDVKLDKCGYWVFMCNVKSMCLRAGYDARVYERENIRYFFFLITMCKVNQVRIFLFLFFYLTDII